MSVAEVPELLVRETVSVLELVSDVLVTVELDVTVELVLVVVVRVVEVEEDAVVVETEL